MAAVESLALQAHAESLCAGCTSRERDDNREPHHSCAWNVAGTIHGLEVLLVLRSCTDATRPALAGSGR